MRRCVLCGLTFLLLAAHMMPYSLLSSRPDSFWCVESQHNGTVDDDPGGQFDPCRVYDARNVDTGRQCQRWEFGADGRGVSIVEDFQLVCHREHLLSVRQVGENVVAV